MKIIYNKWIPFNGFIAMMTICILWVREEFKHKIDDIVINHERIHSYQQVEILILSIIIGSIIMFFTGFSWYSLISLMSPFLIYLLCWIVELVIPPYGSAYKNICFESEAIYNESNLEYCKTRKYFSWIKYMNNKKYPYIPKYER